MASEYLKWKYRNVEHRKKTEYTKEELRKNWWDYHKFHVLFGFLAAILLIDLFRTVAGFKTDMPDIQVAVISSSSLSEEETKAIEETLLLYCEDFNGDGKTIVQVNPYVLGEGETSEETYRNYANEVTLVSDMEECSSYLFILEDADLFQRQFEILRNLDGSLPESFEDASNCAIAIQDLPMLEGIPLKGFYLARRGFWTEKTSENIEQCDNLWQTITQGGY